jgi:hypothetical protein
MLSSEDPSQGHPEPNPRTTWRRKLASSQVTVPAALVGCSVAVKSAAAVIPAEWTKLHGVAEQVNSVPAAGWLIGIATGSLLVLAIKRLGLDLVDSVENFGRERAARRADKKAKLAEALTRLLLAEQAQFKAQTQRNRWQLKALAVPSAEKPMTAPAEAQLKQVKVDPADWRHSDQNAARKAAPFAPKALASATMPLAMSADELKAALLDETLQGEKVDVPVEALAEMLRNPEIRPRQELWQPLSRALYQPDDYFVKGTQLTLECCVRRLRRYHDQGRALVHTYASVENPDELRKFSLKHLRMFVVQVETLLEKEKGGTP